MNTNQPDWPEHEKLKKINRQSQACGEFLDWLTMKGFVLCKWNENERLIPVHVSTHDLLFEFFNIDSKILEDEKQRMLDMLASQ